MHIAQGKNKLCNFARSCSNNAESAHSAVKRTMKQMFFHYGKGAKSLQRNISIATLLYNKSPAERLKSLLEAVRDWDGTSFVYEDVGMIEDPLEMQDDDEPVGDDDDDCSVEEVEPDDEVEEVERTGAPPRKSHRAEKPPAEQPSTDDLSEDMATQRALIAGLSAERSLAYASVVATSAEFDCFAVELLLCHVLQGRSGFVADPRTTYAVFPKDCPCYGAFLENGHWILYRWWYVRSGVQELEEYNSMESTPSHALVKLKNALKRDWGPRRFKIVPQPCEQQKRGSNNCGLACVNAAATLVGGRRLTREDCGAIILGIAPENVEIAPENVGEGVGKSRRKTKK
jgi:hypothetical protein